MGVGTLWALALTLTEPSFLTGSDKSRRIYTPAPLI
jgi:hypothetical protein